MASDLFINVHLKKNTERMLSWYINYQTEWNYNHSILFIFLKVSFYLLVLVLCLEHFILAVASYLAWPLFIIGSSQDPI